MCCTNAHTLSKQTNLLTHLGIFQSRMTSMKPKKLIINTSSRYVYFVCKRHVILHSLTSSFPSRFSPSSTSSVQGNLIFEMHYKFLSFSSYVSLYFFISLSFYIYLILESSVIDFSRFFWRFYFDLCLMLVLYAFVVGVMTSNDFNKIFCKFEKILGFIRKISISPILLNLISQLCIRILTPCYPKQDRAF